MPIIRLNKSVCHKLSQWDVLNQDGWDEKFWMEYQGQQKGNMHCLGWAYTQDGDESEIIGAIAGRVIIHEAELDRIIVHSAFRKQGIGKKLLNHFLLNSQKSGAEQVFLEVREGNRNAIQFYYKQHFVKVGLRPDYYQHPVEAALQMRYVGYN